MVTPYLLLFLPIHSLQSQWFFCIFSYTDNPRSHTGGRVQNSDTPCCKYSLRRSYLGDYFAFFTIEAPK